MNYKKMTFRASMLGLIVMLFAGLVSCSSDDDDKNIPVEETKVPTTGAIVFLYAATEDELSICDMIAEYTDENGATKTEAITATKWKKQINFSSLPAKGLISIKKESSNTYYSYVLDKKKNAQDSYFTIEYLKQ